MHQAAYDYIAQFASDAPLWVFEIGSRDINGSVRPLFPNAHWLGIDRYPGPGVDVVADAERWRPWVRFADLVICCEVLEHTARWPYLIEAAHEWLRPGGQMLITCAGPGRRPHSGIDGKRELQPGEYYGNVGSETLRWVMERVGFAVSAEQVGLDTRASGIRR